MNTNMFVEAFHRKLKTVYFQKKQNRRVDRLVFTLLKIARDLILKDSGKMKLEKEHTGNVKYESVAKQL